VITPEKALTIIERSFIGILKQCSSIEERYRLMNELFQPLGIMESRWLVCQLQRKHGINFGVCTYYSFEDGKQFCSLTPTKVECPCVIPQKYCVPRDRHKDPRRELDRPELQEF